jgi:hypothetical protein
LANYVNKDNNFDHSEPTSRACPHCGSHAQLLPVATPSFEELSRSKPARTGVVLRCSACNEPRFLRAGVRRFGDDRIELSSTLVEVERAKERFPLHYLPEPIDRVFREALECYAADCYHAFAAMCRATVDTLCRQQGRTGKLRAHELFHGAVTAAGLDATTTRQLETVLFGGGDGPAEIGADAAAVLLEIMKDMLSQGYVRAAKLKAALRMRRYFAGESLQSNVTALVRRA